MRYYKILNEEECHRGMKYKTGLNEDVLKFNPHGSCRPGGIYFTREDILAFLDYGPWIREVTLPKEALLYQDPGGTPVKWKADRVILGERRRITAEVVNELIAEGADVHVKNDHALRWASEYGHNDILEVLIKNRADVNALNGYALRWAANGGHTIAVKMLIDAGAYVNAWDTCVLDWAVRNDDEEMIKILFEAGAIVHDDMLSNAISRESWAAAKLLIQHGAKVTKPLCTETLRKLGL